MAESGGGSQSFSLRDAERHFTQLVAGVRDYAIFLLDASGFVKTWNAGAERIKGYSRDDIVGRHFSEFYTPESNAVGWPQHELAVAAREGRFEDEGWRVRKDGSRFWANVVISTLYDDRGEVEGFLKITRDLSERKRTEEALRQSEDRFRVLIDGVKEYAIYMLDPSGLIVSWNRGAERVKGYPAEEVLGKHVSLFYSSEDVLAGKPELELKRALEEGSVEDEGWRVRKDRSLFWANVVVTPLFDGEGRHIGFAKVTRDMTEKRKAAALEVADRQKNEFLAMLAHELRNPLAPISNGLQLLKLPGIDEPTLKETADLMERQLYHLVRLVDDLLDVSRIITGKLTFQMEALEVAVVVNRAVEEARSVIDARGHELMVSLPARPIVVEGDAVRLAQVVCNLLINAAKYTERPDRICLAVEREGDEAVISVRDRGVGIEATVLPRIFNLFVQADNSLARSQGGLGIGLTLVKRIVDIHGGVVTAASAGLGFGSEFTVRLPISKTAEAVSRPAKSTREAIGKRRILVVDDNADAALTIASLLRAWGHDVQTAFNGPSALETARGFRPEIILLDVGLPGMSGYEVAKQLRAEPALHDVTLAALTGYGQESDRRRSLEAGFDYHITKPADPQFLERLLVSPRSGS